MFLTHNLRRLQGTGMAYSGDYLAEDPSRFLETEEG
jgi:hypothetical protein